MLVKTALSQFVPAVEAVAYQPETLRCVKIPGSSPPSSPPDNPAPPPSGNCRTEVLPGSCKTAAVPDCTPRGDPPSASHCYITVCKTRRVCD